MGKTQPHCAARCSGCRPAGLRTAGLAPPASSALTAARWLEAAARCSAAQPSVPSAWLRGASGSRLPFSRRAVIAAELPAAALASSACGAGGGRNPHHFSPRLGLPRMGQAGGLHEAVALS